ncbi:hypothetical protein WMC41_21115 [Shinella yambaruensis]|uniref:hypothetical protein n=1 Tax=Shinella yambaruensis TaxID=415996 RepID=UPI003D790DEF
MAILHFSIAPEYNSVYLASRPIPDVSHNFREKTIPSTPDCISIPCTYWNDGDTSFSVGEASEITMSTPPTFDGFLDTPDKRLVFFGANEPEFASVSVPTVKTRIRIWIDHPREPENVVIAFG